MVDHATIVDPDGHRVTFENDVVHVVEVRLDEGRVIPMHSHPARVIVAVSAYRMRSTDESGRSITVDRAPGDTVWSDGDIHEAEILTGPAHTIEIEVK